MQRRNALVTGASKGIGKAIARRLIADGLNCVLLARDRSALNDTVAELANENCIVVGMVCDVTRPEQVLEVLGKVQQDFGELHVLVNCAGKSGGGVTRNITDQQWIDVVHTNLNSVFFVTRSLLQLGLMKPGGSIINIASTGGKQGVANGAPYSAAKHGVIGFTKSLGLELARDQSGITVNAVCPGFVETEMAQQVRANYAKLWNVSVEESKKRIEERVPIGRYIEPDEVAAMVSYLSTDLARGITAQAMNVCGGLGNY